MQQAYLSTAQLKARLQCEHGRHSFFLSHIADVKMLKLSGVSIVKLDLFIFYVGSPQWDFSKHTKVMVHLAS